MSLLWSPCSGPLFIGTKVDVTRTETPGVLRYVMTGSDGAVLMDELIEDLYFTPEPDIQPVVGRITKVEGNVITVETG